MPYFVMIGWDGSDGPQRRSTHRQAHVSHLHALQREGRIAYAGPIRNEAGDQSIGAVIVYEAQGLAEARELVKHDPYVAGGVFESLTVNPFKQVVPDPS